MTLDLKAVFLNDGMVLPFEHSLDLSDADFFGSTPLTQPVMVKGQFENRAGVVSMKGTAYVRLETPCDRCTAMTVQELTVPVEHLLVTSAVNEESDELVVIPDMQLDPDELLRCDVLWALPAKHLCREDCKGICPDCGKNLNEGKCGCKKSIDPRLEGLLGLLDSD